MAIGITFAKMRLYSMLKRIDHKETTSVPNGFSHEYLILDRKYDKIQSTIICSAISHFLSCRAGNGRREFLCGRYIHLRRTVSSTKEKLLLLQSSGILIPLSPSVPPCIPFSFRLALNSDHLGKNHSPEENCGGSSWSFRRITSCLSSNGMPRRRASCVSFFILPSTQYKWDSSGL